MPKTKPSKLPRTPLRKRFTHTFYLVQPMLQFIVLVTVMIVLSRCSPLSPSKDKGADKGNIQPASAEATETKANPEAALLEESLAEVSTTDLAVISKEDFTALGKNGALIDRNHSLTEVRMLIRKRDQSPQNISERPHLLVLPFDEQLQGSFLQERNVKVNLASRLEEHFTPLARESFINALRNAHDQRVLTAQILLVLPKDAPQKSKKAFAELSVRCKISLGFPSDTTPYLEIQELVDDSKDGRFQEQLLQAALELKPQLAIVLD